MKSLHLAVWFVVPLLAAPVAAAEAKLTAKQALQAFNTLIGEWRGTGEPLGSRDDRLNKFWTETIRWEWQFKGDDAWLLAKIEKGKYFTSGELRYLSEKETYRLVLKTVGKESLTFDGKLKDDRLTLDRKDEAKKENQRLVLSLLHSNRYLLRYEVKGTDQTSYKPVYRVGATKEGVAFAGPGDDKPECIVSGGLGTMPVTHKGKTYYVCCGGCRDAFKEDPDKYVREFEARKAKKKE
jgi:hypothetical protein